MDSYIACHELKEPGVIDEAMIYNAVLEQGPKDEEGRLYKKQGVDYREVTHLRLEFLDILKIDHFWMMTGLTKLQLCNNIIEEIENLDMLTELKELDLSFNNIQKIKNLDTLTKLEVLTLFENKIEILENLDNLTNLSVFSVGNNLISDFSNFLFSLRFFINLSLQTIYYYEIRMDKFTACFRETYYPVWDCEQESKKYILGERMKRMFLCSNVKLRLREVLYLRGFNSLKSLNMAGNPVCEEENFVNHVIAYLPQLVYYEYRMIKRERRKEARELFLKDLIKLERDEEELKEREAIKKREEEQEKINEKAFVEGFRGDELFLMMFENDSDGTTLLHMGDAIMDIYKEYKKSFCEVTKEILALGLEQAEMRQTEMDEFNSSITKATETAYAESRKIMEDFQEQKQAIFNQIRAILDTEEEDDETIAELSLEVQAINENFQDLCLQTWNTLMKKELDFYEACEEVNSTYERNLSEMVNQFVESAQALFTQLRQFQGVFNENITDAANKFFTYYTVATAGGLLTKEDGNLPAELINMMQDREALVNGLAASHDLHMLVIDQREDKLISGIRNWLTNLVDNLVRTEIQRNRDTVTEINHFLDTQKAELDEITSTPLGLLLLPKEVQDALQIT